MATRRATGSIVSLTQRAAGVWGRRPGEQPWTPRSGPKEPHDVPTGAWLLERLKALKVKPTALAATLSEPVDVLAVLSGDDDRVHSRQVCADGLNVLAGRNGP